MEEIWKPVVGFEGLYEVSSLGRVRSLDKIVGYPWGIKKTARKRGKVLSPKIANTGYHEVVLIGHDGSRNNKRMHRLVAEAFIPNPNNYPVINHIDENKLNNIISNLEWCTVRYNTEEYTKKRNLIYQYDLSGNLIREWNSITRAGEYVNGDKTGIQHCCAGKIKTFKNFIWTYVPLTKEELHRRLQDNNSKEVLQYDINGNLINTYKSTAAAARALSCSQSLISTTCQGLRKDCKKDTYGNTKKIFKGYKLGRR